MSTTHDALRERMDELHQHMTALANAEMELTPDAYETLDSWEGVTSAVGYLESAIDSLSRDARVKLRAAERAVEDIEEAKFS